MKRKYHHYNHIVINGAGPTGLALAYLLTFFVDHITIYEKRSKEDCTAEHDRSVNLALSRKGWDILARLGIWKYFEPQTVEMFGRMIHDPYGKKEPSQHRYSGKNTKGFILNSASRSVLNKWLLQQVLAHRKINVIFEVGVERLLPDNQHILLTNNTLVPLDKFDFIVDTSGVGSPLRNSLMKKGFIEAERNYIGHSYLEITFPKGSFSKSEFKNLHIWSREGEQMVIALPNSDGTATGGIFGKEVGKISFEAIKKIGAAQYFLKYFPNVVEKVPDIAKQYTNKQLSRLSEVHCNKFYWKNVILLGDAAFAVVPYFGMGLNYGLHAAGELADYLYELPLEEALKKYQTLKESSDLLAGWSMRNFLEMSAAYTPELTLRNQIDIQLESESDYCNLHSLVSFTTMPFPQIAQELKRQEKQFQKVLKLPNVYEKWDSDLWPEIKMIMTS
jgi:kynurenine 3-monooxygenase